MAVKNIKNLQFESGDLPAVGVKSEKSKFVQAECKEFTLCRGAAKLHGVKRHKSDKLKAVF